MRRLDGINALPRTRAGHFGTIEEEHHGARRHPYPAPRKLVEVFGVDEADLLMDRPPGGWGDLVTNQTLDLRIAASEARMEGQLAELGARMEGRFTDSDHRMTAGFAQVEARFTDSDHRMTAGFDIIAYKLTAQRADLLSEIERGFRNQTWKLVGVMTALMAIVVAALRV